MADLQPLVGQHLDQEDYSKLRTALLDIALPLTSLGIDLVKAALLISSHISAGSIEDPALYGLTAAALKWAPALATALHLQDTARRRGRVAPTMVYVVESRAVSSYGGHHQVSAKAHKERGLKDVLSLLLQGLLLLLLFPLLPPAAHLESLGCPVLPVTSETACMLSVVTTGVEAPLQILLTLWLVMRGVIQSPFVQDLQVVTWSVDRFGNPFPLPTLPLASLLASYLSLLIITVRINSFLLDIHSPMEFLSRLVFLIVSVSYRVVSLSFLWLYFDRKCLVIFIIIIATNFTVVYVLEVRKTRHVEPGFSIWSSSLLALFVPCWYLGASPKKGKEGDQVMANLRNLAMFGNTIILLSINICCFLVNKSVFKYSNNCFDNVTFNFTCGFLLLLGSLLLITSLLSNHLPSLMPAGGRTISLLFSLLLLLLPLLLLHLFSITGPPGSSFPMVAQHQEQGMEGVRIILARVMGRRLGMVRAGLAGGLVTCDKVGAENSTSQDMAKTLLMDLDNPACLALLDHLESMPHISGVLVLESWFHLSSSPFPSDHQGTDLSPLLHLPLPVATLPRLEEGVRRRFLTLPTLLLPYPPPTLTVACPPLPCLSPEGPVFLGRTGEPSIRVEVVRGREEPSPSLHKLVEEAPAAREEDVACRGGLGGGELEEVLCGEERGWWDERTLDNYQCCNVGGEGVFSSPKCVGAQEEGLVWGGWSEWGPCREEVGASEVEKVRRRFRLARGGVEGCVWVGRKTETCGGEGRGGCTLPWVLERIPSC